MRFMSDFREAMWGVVQSGVSELDFDFDDYADEALRRGMRETAADPRVRDLARGGAWRRGLSCPTRARCVIIGGGVGGDLDRLPPGEARLGGRGPARARPAHLGLDLPLGRPGGPAARLGLADEDDDALGRALPAARRRVRVRPRLGRVRRHPARLERGADGGAAPPGGLGEDLRPAAGADLGRGGEGDVPADVHRGRARRGLAADRRLPRPRPSSPTRSPTAPARGRLHGLHRTPG